MNRIKSFILFLILLALLPVQAQSGLYREAPMLATRVEIGELPPVDDRLPILPMVLQADEVGDYGGTWTFGLRGSSNENRMQTVIAYEGLVRWDETASDIIPNLAQSWDISADGTEFTFFLREGIRWSDGERFTTDDIMFWYNEIFHTLADSNFSGASRVEGLNILNGEPVIVEAVDSQTIQFTFAAPNGIFLQLLASSAGTSFVRYPEHYARQFLPHLNSDEDIQAQIEAHNIIDANGDEVIDWVDLFIEKLGSRDGNSSGDSWFENPDLPVLHPWVVVDHNEIGYIAERNPYFWKIDRDFNQLPYIDQIHFVDYGSRQASSDAGWNGELDNQFTNLQNVSPDTWSHITDLGFEFFPVIPSSMNVFVISFNMNHPTWGELFSNRDFRVGLSYAINRQEIIDEYLNSTSEINQVAPLDYTPFYNEELATQYTEYNIDLANEYLDRAGIANRDDAGYRLTADGRRVSLNIVIQHVAGDIRPNLIEHFAAVGIELQASDMTTDEFGTLLNIRDFSYEIVMTEGEGGLEVMQTPDNYVPISSWSLFAPAWGIYFDNPDDPAAIEPPAAVLNQQNLYRQLVSTIIFEEKQALMQEILEISREQFYAIGIATQPLFYGINRTNMGNIPPFVFDSWTYQAPAYTNPATYFFREQ